MAAPVDSTSSLNSPSAYTDLSGLSALKRESKTQSPEAVRKVAQQFESIFTKMVLSSMRQANFGDQLFGSDQTQFYQGMFDDQLSVEMTKGKGLGLADMLVQQLTRSGLVKSGDAAGTTGDAPSAAAGRASANSAWQSGTTSAAGSVGKKDASLFGASAGADMKRGFFLDAARGTRTAPSAASSRTDASSRADASSAANAPSPTDSAATSSSNAPWKPGSPEEFVQKLWPCAEEAGKALGVDPKHLLAQAALETGWGKSVPCDADGSPSFNFFGIKAGTSWQGDSVSAKTLEFEGGVPVPKQAKFRAYDSPADSFRDYVDVLRNNPRYASALNTGSDATAFAIGLQRGGYATDPRYAMKIEAAASAIAQNLPISETALKSSSSAPMTQPIDLF